MEHTHTLYEAFGTNESDGMRDSWKFRIGCTYETLGGLEVVCIALHDQRDYECAQFSDGKWRYNRPHDRGRCTGAEWTNVSNVIPIKLSACEDARANFEQAVTNILASVGASDVIMFARNSNGSYSRHRTAKLWEDFVHGMFPYTSRNRHDAIKSRYLSLMTEAAKLKRDMDQMVALDE